VTTAGQVIIDPEIAIAKLDKLDKDIKELRDLFRTGFTTKTPPTESTAFDIGGIRWMLAKKDGGGEANLDDAFAWSFAANQTGQVPPEKKPLVEYLKQHGKVQQNGYELSISQDGKFLNRKRLTAR
jgi:hypothetical protein